MSQGCDSEDEGNKIVRVERERDYVKIRPNIEQTETPSSKNLTSQSKNEIEVEKKNLKKINFFYFLKLWIIIFLTILLFIQKEYYVT